MPNFGVFPLSTNLLAATTVTTNTTGSATTVPLASSYRLTVQITTVSGTSPTLVVGLYSSSDGGTTYHGLLNSAQMTTSGQGFSIVFRPYLGIGDAATEAASPLLGTADFTNTSSPVLTNGPFDPRFVKLRLVVGGTSPSFSATTVFLDAVPQDLSD